MKKLSGPQIRLLRNLRLYEDVAFHCKTQSDYGGLTMTIRWALKHELIKYKDGYGGRYPIPTHKGKMLAAKHK